MIPASCAVASASPFGRSRSRARRLRRHRAPAPRATARRRDSGFAADVDHPDRAGLVDVRELAHRRAYRRATCASSRRWRHAARQRSRPVAVQHVEHARERRSRRARRTGTTTARRTRPRSESTILHLHAARTARASSASARSPSSFTPPHGAWPARTSSRSRSSTPSRPRCARATRSAFARSRDHTLAPRPNSLSFATLHRLVLVVERLDGDDRAEDLLALDPRRGRAASTVGSRNQPGRPTSGRRRPCALGLARPLATSSSTFARCRSEISGPSSVSVAASAEPQRARAPASPATKSLVDGRARRRCARRSTQAWPR